MAVKVIAPPRQAVGELAAMFTVGELFTTTVNNTVELHPAGMLPLPETLYVVVFSAVTVITDDVVMPVLNI